MNLRGKKKDNIKGKRKKRFKTPLFLQMEAVECGAASLGIILAYYGLYMPLEKLRQECGVSRDGSNAANIVLAGEKLGLKGLGYRYTPEEVKNAPLPLILHWGFNHFVVLEGFDGDKVFLNDPATGHRTVDWEEFSYTYTGIALYLSPGPDFIKGGSRPSIWNSLWKRLNENKKALIFMLFIGLGLSIIGLATPIFSQIFFDDILSYKHRPWLFELLLAMGVALVLKTCLTILKLWSLTRWQASMTIKESAKFFYHILRLPIEFFQQRYAGEIASRVQFNEAIANFVTGQMATVAIDVAAALFYIFLLFQYNAYLTIIGLVFTFCNVGILVVTYNWMTEQQLKVQQETGRLYGVTISGLYSMETLKANGNEFDFFVKWANYNSKLLKLSQKNEYYAQFISLLPILLGGINTAAIMAVGGFAIMDGLMTIGIFVAFQGLMSSFQEPVGKILALSQSIQQSQAQMYKLDDVFSYKTDDFHFYKKPVETAKTHLGGHLELKNVYFGYSPLDKPLLRKFNLKLSPGQRIAIAGSSGSGKSTVAKLASGLFQPWEGEILFDGVPAIEIPREIVASTVAVVEQDILLFEGTVSENITLFDYTIEHKDIVRAAKDAVIHQDIAALNNGYEAIVKEGGYNFSGGQRQRIEIARALCHNPSVIILDEATSALDAVTEKILMDNLRRRGCALIIIAHRLSTIKDCDEIIVLSKGRVVERGRHEELMLNDGHYRRLVALDENIK